MKCKKCGSEIAEGSVFCQNCGEKVKTEAPTPEKPTEAKAPSPVTPNVPKPATPVTPTPVTSNAPSKKKSSPVIFILIGLIVVLVISNFVFLLGSLRGGNNPIISGSKNNDVVICDTSSKIKADLFDEMTSFMISNNAGKASSKFYASDKVIIVDRNTFDRSFTATMKYYKPARMYWEYDDTYATVTTKKFKGFKAKMMITPKMPGAFYVRFTNSKNNQEFKVLVIITE